MSVDARMDGRLVDDGELWLLGEGKQDDNGRRAWKFMRCFGAMNRHEVGERCLRVERVVILWLSSAGEDGLCHMLGRYIRGNAAFRACFMTKLCYD